MARPLMNPAPVRIHVPESLRDEIDALAQGLGITRADYVRRALVRSVNTDKAADHANVIDEAWAMIETHGLAAAKRHLLTALK